MSDNLSEKRIFPRVGADLEVKLPKNIPAESFNFSEGGLSFSSREIISSPEVLLSLKLPHKKAAFEAEAQLIWQRDMSSGDSLYGVKFLRLKNSQKEILREEMVYNQLKKLVENIKDKETKEYISRFFSKDILEYVSKITELTSGHWGVVEYSRSLENKLESLNNKMLLKGYCLELLLSDKKVLEKVKKSFRDLAGAWLYKSIIIKRAFEKPGGYPEDSRMLDLIYENKPVSKNIGLYFDNIFLKSPYSVSIRNRKNYLSRKIIDFVNQSRLDAVDVLSVCSGTGREVIDAIPLFNSLKKVNFTFIETEKKALDFLKNSLDKNTKNNINFEFRPEAIFRMLGKNDFLNSYRRQNFIYTLGIIDYLSDRAAKKILKILYGLLKNQGHLVLTHRNRDKTFPPIPPDWLCDWKVISRNKEEVVQLIYQVGISDFTLNVESDNFGYIHYFILTKNEDTVKGCMKNRDKNGMYSAESADSSRCHSEESGG